MPRKKPKANKADPLFNEEPQPEATPCGVPGCKLKAVPTSKYCILHEALDSGRKTTQVKQRQAAKKGDTLSSVLWGLGGMLVDVVNAVGTDYINKAAENPTATAQQAQQAWQNFRAQPPPPPPPPPPRIDPFAVLGLDPTKATIADVKMVQRKLAAIYHTDKGVSAVNATKLAEINAAADECLKKLKKNS